MKGLRRGFSVIAVGALALLRATESPAPPPPILNCSSAAPVSIALQYPVDVHGSINSELSGFQIQAFDAGDNPVANVPITVRAPASGPSATLLISAANYNVRCRNRPGVSCLEPARRFEPSHTASRTIRDQMVARGYAAEGYGPDAVIMCAAPR